MDKKSEIVELEDLARQFIIGYAPLTDKQKGFIIDIALLEQKRDAHKRMVKRYERVISVLYQNLAEVPDTTTGDD